MYVTAHCDWAFLAMHECGAELQQRMAHTTGCTLDSSWSTSRAWGTVQSAYAVFAVYLRERVAHTLSHSLCTSLSASCLQFMRLSIQPSRVGIVVGSDVGTDDICMGSGILTSSMLVSMIAGRRVRCRWGGRVLWCRAVEGFFPSNSANDVDWIRVRAIWRAGLGGVGRRAGEIGVVCRELAGVAAGFNTGYTG